METMDRLAPLQIDPAEGAARREFLTEPVGKLIVRHGSPAVISMAFQALYQIVDGIMVGRSLGPEAMASVNVLYPLVALVAGLAVMIGTGGNARTAILLGEGDHRSASRVLGTILVLGFLLGIVGAVITAALTPQLLAFLGVGQVLSGYVRDYLLGLLPFFWGMILVFILEQSVRNDGKAALASLVMAGSALVNIFLDYLFLFVLDFGIIGAAWATGISQTGAALVFFGYFLVKTLRGTPGLSLGRPVRDARTLITICRNGASELLNSLSGGVTTFLFNRVLLSFLGALGVAAFTVVQYPVMLGVMVVLGLGSGVQPVFSYNHGAGEVLRVRRALEITLVVSFLVGVLLWFSLGAPARMIAGVFLPGHGEAQRVAAEAASFFRWVALCMPLGIIASVYFTAREEAGKSLVIALARGLVLPVAGILLLPLWLGVPGIWLTPVIAEVVACVIALGLIKSSGEGGSCRNGAVQA
ncbi:putative efflux protein, MATE family [Alkalispirochaeta americana]|uniref:Multidrug export protein MepA n=1 Tax=Alkalispirochaeta americana TaxID=159291 RepID=A0A1N6SJZ9_9SPIO|nr:MATE family efflux transporter [Alkalispirochaeta americana]SIQ41443.1 putative efflux protein, MATE family [Alkalispirochaeta americana]